MEVCIDRQRYPWLIGALNTGHLFIDFANSEWYDGRGHLRDRLRDPSWRRAFLEEWGLERYGPLDGASLRELVDLRSALRSIAESLHRGRRPDERDLEHLNRVLAAHPVRFRLSGGGPQPELDAVPLPGRGSGSIAGEIALSAAQFLAEGELDRLKLCANPGCRWMFYDETKNRSRRWCGPCGNVDKVRRYRERQRRGRVR
jgi:predicted RNA-binding Zn ribbon-like protein